MPESVPLPLRGQLENARQLERQVDQIAKRASKNLKIDFTGGGKNIDSLSQPLGRITGKADEFTKSMEAANARVIAFGASVGILSAVTQSFKALVTTTIEVEKSLAKINSILNTNASGLERLKSQIFDIAKNTEQTFDTVSEAALELSRQGLSATEVTKRLNDSLILSRLSGVDAAEAVGSLTAAVNGFSKSGLNTSEILNKVSAAANKFAVSERDLFEGFKRSASVAQQAGVSLDELGGIITAVQQKTARGGAVIGNSLKTIFTRIGKEESVSLLRDLGVEITNVEGNLLPATQVIENLAKSFDTLSESQQRQVAFKIGGGFQIAPLLAALQDYSQENSIAIKATEAFSNATDEAYKKNIALNETLAAGIQSTSLSVQELANTLGELGVTDVFGTLLTSIGGVVEKVTGVLQGDGIGSTFARGLVKGVSSLILPALGLVVVIIGKLSKDLLKFGVDSLKTFLGLSNAAERLKSVEERTYQILLNNEDVRKQILTIENASISAEQKKVLQSELFTKSLVAQKSIMLELQQISSRVAPGIISGVTGGAKSRISRSAGGFLPVGAEQRDINSGVGGAPKGSKPVVIPNFAFGGGQRGTMVANSSEYIVPNFAGGGSAIFNQDMVKSMGLPSGAKKINAAGGFIPNFARMRQVNQDSKYILLTGDSSADRNNTLYSGPLKKGNKTGSYTDLKQAQLYLKEGLITQVNIPTYGLSQNERSKSSGGSATATDIDFLEVKLADAASTLALDYAKGLSPSNRVPDATKKQVEKLFNKGSLSGFAGSIFETGLASIMSSSEFKDYSSRTDTSRIDLPYSPALFKKFGAKEVGQGGAEVKNRAKGDQLKSTANKFFDILVGGRKAFERKQGSKETNLVGKKLLREDAIRLKFLKRNAKGKYPNRTYTIKKNDLSKLEGESFTSDKTTGVLKRAASGYIPNFAQNQSPLEQAIGRERDAGVPINQIRINQDGKLRNSQNPQGIAVTNTRDEPTGAIPRNAARGYTPNFAAGDRNKVGDAAEASSGKLFALSTAAFAVQGALSGVSQEATGFTKNLGEASAGLSGMLTTVLLLQGLNAKPGLSRNMNATAGQGLINSGRARIEAGNRISKRQAFLSRGQIVANKVVGAKGVAGGAIRVGAGKLALGFSRLVPILGTAVLAFQGLGAILKLSGTSYTKLAEKFGLIDGPAERAADNLGKLSAAALSAALNTGKASTKPFEDFLNRVGTLNDDRLKEGLSKAGQEKVESGQKVGDVAFAEALGASLVGGVVEKNISDKLGNVSLGIGGSDSFKAVRKEQEIQKALIQGSGISGNNFDNGGFSEGKIKAFIDLQFSALQSFATPEEFADVAKLIKSGKGEEAGQKIGSIIEALPSETKKQYEDLVKKVSDLDLGGKDSDQKLKNILKKLIESEKASQKIKRIEEERVTLNADIAKIQSESAFNIKLAIAGAKTEEEIRLGIKNTLKETSNLEKFNNTTRLKQLESERKTRIKSAKEFKNLLDAQGSIKTLLQPDDNQDIDPEKLKKYNDILDSISDKIIKNGEVSKKQVEAALVNSGILDKDDKRLGVIVDKALAQLTATKQLAGVELGRLQTSRAIAESEKLAAESRERQLKFAERQLTTETRRIDRNRESQDLADQIKIAGIRSQGIGGNSRAGASVQRQTAEVERVAKIRQAAQSSIKAQEKIQKDFIAILREAGANISKTDVEDIQLSGQDRGAFDKILKRTAEEQKKIQIKALELQKSEIQNALLNGNTAQINATAAKLMLEAAQLNSGSAIVDAVNSVSGSLIGQDPDTEANIEALKERLKVLKDEMKNLKELDFSTFSGKASDALKDFNKSMEVSGQKIVLADLQFRNALAESGASLTTFANLVRAEFNSIADQKAQNAFSLATSTDPSAIEGALASKSRISTLETASGTGAEKIAQANELALFQQKELDLIGAKDAATRVSLEFEYDKKLEIIELGRQENELNSKEPGYAEKVLEIRKKIAAVKAKDQTLSEKLASRGVTNEQMAQGLEDTFVSASETFVNNLSDGINQAIAKGGDLGDVLQQVALDFFSTMAAESQKLLMKRLFFGDGGSESGSGGGTGGIIGSIVGAFTSNAKASGGMITGGSGSKDDVPALLMGGEYVMKKNAVNKYGSNFMESINNGKAPKEIQRFANGGMVIPDEEEIQSGRGGFFAPGTYGGSIKGSQQLLDFASQAFTSGERDVISSSSNQFGGASKIALESESVRLTNRGRNMGTPLQQATQEAKQQGFGLYGQQVELEKQVEEQRKARKKQIKGMITGALISIAASGVGQAAKGFMKGGKANLASLGENATFGEKAGAFFKGGLFGGEVDGPGGSSINVGGLSNLFNGKGQIGSSLELQEYISKNPSSTLAQSFTRNAYSKSPIRGASDRTGLSDILNRKPKGFDYNVKQLATGGSIPEVAGVDTVPAMLSGGEFVMNSAATSRIGQGNLQKMNSGVGGTEESGSGSSAELVSKLDELIQATKESTGEINITVNGESGEEKEDSKGGNDNNSLKMAKQLKEQVLKVIKDEKRLGGSLRDM